MARIGSCRAQNFYIYKYFLSLVTGSNEINSTCLASVYDNFLGWGGLTMIFNTSFSQVGLNLDWPTGLSLATLKAFHSDGREASLKI